MKKTILLFGAATGLVIGLSVVIITWMVTAHPDFKASEITGYTIQVVAFSLIFVAVRRFRDSSPGGALSFWQAFKIGVGITLIGGTIYVLIWLVEFYFFMPDFMEKYARHMEEAARASGLTGAALQKKIDGINSIKIMYRNPAFVVLMTYLEVLPVGLLVSLITALILRRKRNAATVEVGQLA